MEWEVSYAPHDVPLRSEIGAQGAGRFRLGRYRRLAELEGQIDAAAAEVEELRARLRARPPTSPRSPTSPASAGEVDFHLQAPSSPKSLLLPRPPLSPKSLGARSACPAQRRAGDGGDDAVAPRGLSAGRGVEGASPWRSAGCVAEDALPWSAAQCDVDAAAATDGAGGASPGACVGVRGGSPGEFFGADRLAARSRDAAGAVATHAGLREARFRYQRRRAPAAVAAAQEAASPADAAAAQRRREAQRGPEGAPPQRGSAAAPAQRGLDAAAAAASPEPSWGHGAHRLALGGAAARRRASRPRQRLLLEAAGAAVGPARWDIGGCSALGAPPAAPRSFAWPPLEHLPGYDGSAAAPRDAPPAEVDPYEPHRLDFLEGSASVLRHKLRAAFLDIAERPPPMGP